MRAIGIIPARLQSTRLPEKLLANICGKPMIQHVYEAAKKAECLDEVIIATDSARIVRVAQSFGGHVTLTLLPHKSGTMRVGEAAMRQSLSGDDIVVNIQGDEPLIAPESIDLLARAMFDNCMLNMATLAYRTSRHREDPNVVKVVKDALGYALYFSRSLIPYGTKSYWKHIGIYAYRKKFLTNYLLLPHSQLEKDERLEQLRALEHGYKIMIIESKQDTHSVDTEADLESVRRIMKEREEKVHG